MTPSDPVRIVDKDGRAIDSNNPLATSATIGSVSLEATGLATETKQDTQITNLQAIKTALEILDNIVSGNEAQVDIVSGSVGLTGNLPDTVTGDLAAIVAALAGTLTAQLSGDLPDTAAGDLAAIKTAVQILDNIVSGSEAQVDVVTLPGAIQGPGNPIVTSFTPAVIDLAASTANQVLVAAQGVNTQIWVYGLFMMADTAAGTVTLQDEDDIAHSGTMAVSDEGGWVLPISGNFSMPWIKVATNKALEADTGACTVDGILVYGVIDVS